MSSEWSGKPEGNRPLGRSRQKWGVLKWNLEILCVTVWTGFIWLNTGFGVRFSCVLPYPRSRFASFVRDG